MISVLRSQFSDLSSRLAVLSSQFSALGFKVSTEDIRKLRAES
jgi:hypothetical protein